MGLYNNTAETERLLTENYERYYRLAFKLMRNQDDALDVVQESAYRAIKDCKGVRNKDYLSTWIYRIVVNTSLDMLRRKKKRNTHRRNAGDSHRGPLPGPGLKTDDKPAG